MGFSNSDKKRNYAKIEIKKNKEVLPRFCIYQGKDEETLDFTNYEGYLFSVTRSDYEYEGENVKQVVFKFVDNHGEETWIKTGYTGVMRSMVNSLAGKKTGLISIRLYAKTKDGRTRANVYMENNGERMDWKYQIDEMPAMKEIEVPGKKSLWDSTELDSFIDKVIKEEIIPNLSYPEGIVKPDDSEQATDNTEGSMLDDVRKEKEERKEKKSSAVDEDDDLPF